MEKLTPAHGKAKMEQGLRHLAIRLQSRPETKEMAPEIRAEVASIREGDDVWLEARQARIAASAEIVYLDEKVGEDVMDLSRAALVEVKGDRNDERYKRVFIENPSEALKPVGGSKQTRFVRAVINQVGAESTLPGAARPSLRHRRFAHRAERRRGPPRRALRSGGDGVGGAQGPLREGVPHVQPHVPAPPAHLPQRSPPRGELLPRVEQPRQGRERLTVARGRIYCLCDTLAALRAASGTPGRPLDALRRACRALGRSVAALRAGLRSAGEPVAAPRAASRKSGTPLDAPLAQRGTQTKRSVPPRVGRKSQV